MYIWKKESTRVVIREKFIFDQQEYSYKKAVKSTVF